MGLVQYNRDQRTANRIIDTLVRHDGACGISLPVLVELGAPTRSHLLGDWTQARVANMLEMLVDFEAVRAEDDIDGNRYFVGDFAKVLEVARGEVTAFADGFR